MKRIRKPLPIFEQVEIEDITIEGKAVAKIYYGEDNRKLTIFVSHAVPGDIADLRIVEKKKNYIEAVPIKFHKYSEKRVDAFCEHFGTCGGCTRQFLSYADQLFYKEKATNDVLQRIGKIELPVPEPIMESPDIKYYRNKLEYTFSDKRWLTENDMSSRYEITDNDALGFHVPGRFDKVLDIKNCYLQASPSNDIRLSVKEYSQRNNLTFFNIREQHGLLRTLMIRTSVTGDVMVVISYFEDNFEKIEGLLEHLAQKFPEITSLNYVHNPKQNDSISNLEINTYAGNPYITEEMEDLKFLVGPKSFYQTNAKQALNLYRLVEEYADLQGHEIIYDLYTGTGTIAQFLARRAQKVIGIESIAAAIDDAKQNAVLNNLSDTHFFAGDMKDILTLEFVHTQGKPDLIVTDPPRAGMHKDVIQTLLNIEAKRIIYVSCNPATQARDLQLLDSKYKVLRTRPVDMFPHTHHTENIVLLELR